MEKLNFWSQFFKLSNFLVKVSELKMSKICSCFKTFPKICSVTQNLFNQRLYLIQKETISMNELSPCHQSSLFRILISRLNHLLAIENSLVYRIWNQIWRTPYNLNLLNSQPEKEALNEPTKWVLLDHRDPSSHEI